MRVAGWPLEARSCEGYMKQLVQDLRSKGISILDVPVPTPGPGMVLIRTRASLLSVGTERMLVEFASLGLLGKARSRPDLVRQTLQKARREGILSTLKAVQNRLGQWMPLGYSSAGDVVGLGDDVQGLKVGDRVACAGGGYAVHAEYAIVPRNLVVPLPDDVTYDSAAFATLGAIAMHGFRLAEPQLGERVAIIGLGLLGLLAQGIAQAAGCQVFGIDVDPERVELARALGAQASMRSGAEDAALSFSDGMGNDIVLICADTDANDPVELAGAIARDRGRVVSIGAVGMQIPRPLYFGKELAFIVSRSYGPGRYDPSYEEGGQDYPPGYVRWTEGRNLQAIVDLMANGQLDVDPLISHRFPLADAKDAYALITGERDESFLAVLLTYTAEETPGVRSVSLRPATAIASANVGLGVFGAGNFATATLFPALKGVPEVKLVGLATTSGLSSAGAGKRFGFEFATTDADRILQDERINAVAILTRHHLHAEQIAAALAAGKHVFCEKPLAISPDELETILNALQGSDRLLMVGFNRRFAPLAQKMKAFLQSVQEPLLMHYRVNAGCLPASHWLHDPRQGGGRIIGEGCHFIDFLTFLAGSIPARVSAAGLPDSKRYREDNVSITVEFANGSVGTVHYMANGDRSVPKERVEVFGGQRVAVLHDFRSLDLIVDGRRQSRRAQGGQDKGHRAELRAFASAILAGGAPPIPMAQLFSVTQATFAAVDALRSGEPRSVDPWLDDECLP